MAHLVASYAHSADFIILFQALVAISQTSFFITSPTSHAFFTTLSAHDFIAASVVL
jgi:hypothetical protein